MLKSPVNYVGLVSEKHLLFCVFHNFMFSFSRRALPCSPLVDGFVRAPIASAAPWHGEQEVFAEMVLFFAVMATQMRGDELN